MESVPYELPPAVRDRPLHGDDLEEDRGQLHRDQNVEGKFVINPPDSTVNTNGMKGIVLERRNRSNK